MLLQRVLIREEERILDIFVSKVSKIPALIEVMRLHVVDEKAFDDITRLHSESMIQRYDTIYDLLEQNARIEHEFLFLLKLSMQIPALQKHEYFVYIRDFIISYERDMRSRFSLYNHAVDSWNRFIFIKNSTIIWLILPWMTRTKV